MTASGKISMNGRVEMYGNEMEDLVRRGPVVSQRRGRLLGGSRTCVTQTTTTECTVDEQSQLNNENTGPTHSTYKTSGFGTRKVKDMRSGKEMDFLEEVINQPLKEKILPLDEY
jgi:hypothetical protein